MQVKTFDDKKNGLVLICEGGRDLPFEIKRFYLITNLSLEAVRGRHAHKTLEQYIFCAKGSFDLELDDGEKKQTIRMSDSGEGIRLGPMLWHTMRNFSDDCTIIVAAGEHYDESDYIRDYDAFKALIKK